MLRVALTGGIASGKSLVCKLFAELGTAIVDADLIARQMVEPGSVGLARVVEAFGDETLLADGRLDRSALRQRVFSDAQQRQRLDSILHPLIYSAIDETISLLQAEYCLVAVPLLVETAKALHFDRVLVVDCPEDLQMKRLLKRDQHDAKLAQAIIASQATRQQRLVIADDVIDNSGTLAHLAEQVKSLHNSYIILATTWKSQA